MADFSTTALVSAVKRKAAIPTNQNLFSTDDLIQILNEELQVTLVPLLLKLREEYFVTYQDFTSATSDNEYTIPVRAIGNKLRDVVYVDSSGEMINLPRLSTEEISIGLSNYKNFIVNPHGFYLRANKLVLYPKTTVTISSSKALRMYYYRRPNDLISTDNCAKIVTISGSDVIVDNIPSTWTTSTVIDIIQNTTPFMILQEGGTMPTINTGTSTITLGAVPTGLAAGDYICVTGESPIPQLPYDAFPILTQAAVIKCLEAMGDQKGIELAQSKYNMALDDFIVMFSPRVDGEPRKVTSRGGIFDYNNFGRYLY